MKPLAGFYLENFVWGGGGGVSKYGPHMALQGRKCAPSRAEYKDFCKWCTETSFLAQIDSSWSRYNSTSSLASRIFDEIYINPENCTRLQEHIASYYELYIFLAANHFMI